MWVCPAKFLSSEFSTTYMENVGLFFSFSLNGGLPTPLVFDLDVGQRVVMALNSCICPCVCVRVFACVGECVSMCVCVCACSCCVPGCPSSIGLTLYGIPQGGPGLCASGECQGERNDSTVSDITDADTGRKGAKIRRL